MRHIRGDFEVHLTIHPSGKLDAFRSWCEAEGCKWTHIVLARGAQVEQPMATWRCRQTALSDVLADAERRIHDLEQAGFVVVRTKVEADPLSGDVPATDEAAVLEPTGTYFEHHVKLRGKVTQPRERLLDICLAHAAHLSHNARRQLADGNEERFVTQRSRRVGRETSQHRLECLLADLEAAREKVIDIESEYVVHDSNLGLDSGWLPGDSA